MFNNGFNQVITYWAPLPGDDGFGKLVLAAPITIKGRWEDKQEQTINAQGREIISRAHILTPSKVVPLAIGGYLFLGVSTNLDPRKVAGAYEIQNTGSIPDLRNLEQLRTSIL